MGGKHIQNKCSELKLVMARTFKLPVGPVLKDHSKTPKVLIPPSAFDRVQGFLRRYGVGRRLKDAAQAHDLIREGWIPPETMLPANRSL